MVGQLAFWGIGHRNWKIAIYEHEINRRTWSTASHGWRYDDAENVGRLVQKSE